MGGYCICGYAADKSLMKGGVDGSNQVAKSVRVYLLNGMGIRSMRSSKEAPQHFVLGFLDTRTK